MATYRKLQVFNQTTDFAKAVKLVTVPLVAPKPNQVRVRNVYVGLNATDVNTTAGRVRPTNFKIPHDVGLESLGVVDAIGSSIPAGKFTVGQAVLYNAVVNGFTPGAYSEYSYNPVDELFPVPDLNPDYLSTIFNGLTAASALDRNGLIKAGDKVLITAAAGGTGQIAVQWAKQRGCYVIGTVSSEEKEKFLYDLGADFVINYRKQNLDQVLSDKFPNGIDVIWETIGGETFKMLMNHLANKGRMVMIGSITSFKEEDPTKFVHDINISSLVLIGGSKFITGYSLILEDKHVEYMTKLVTAIGNGTIKTQIDQGERSVEGKFFGLEQIARAHEWLYSGKNIGKVVVQIQQI